MVQTKPARSWFWAAVRQRCPRCRQGNVFRTRTVMHEHCPVCGVKFEREAGYFLGAMYFSYFMSVLFLGAAFAALCVLLPNLAPEWSAVLAVVAFVPFVPATYRYSRIIWMYFDEWAWPAS